MIPGVAWPVFRPLGVQASQDTDERPLGLPQTLQAFLQGAFPCGQRARTPDAKLRGPASGASLVALTAAEGPELESRLPSAYQQQAVTREDLGRATWTLMHTLAAQYPEQPSRQQQKDVRSLVSAMFLSPKLRTAGQRQLPDLDCDQVDALTRIYPCGDCAEHFGEIVKCATLPLLCLILEIVGTF